MAFIPRTSPPPRKPPEPRTFRVAGPSSGTAKPILGLVLGGLLLLFYGYDFYRSATYTGIYRQEFAGEVVYARPTLLSATDFFSTRSRRSWSSRDSHWRDGENIGHYVLYLRDDQGQTLKIAVSANTYRSTLIPSYVVGHAGSMRSFRSRVEAVKAGAAERQPGDPF